MTKIGRASKIARLVERYGDEIEQLIVDFGLVPVDIVPPEVVQAYAKHVVAHNLEREFEKPHVITAMYLRDAKKRSKLRKEAYRKQNKEMVLFNL